MGLDLGSLLITPRKGPNDPQNSKAARRIQNQSGNCKGLGGPSDDSKRMKQSINQIGENMIRINEKRSHDIYFTVDIDGMYGLLTLQGNKEECIAKANAWLQWEVSKRTTVQGEWEETDYLTFHWRAA